MIADEDASSRRDKRKNCSICCFAVYIFINWEDLMEIESERGISKSNLINKITVKRLFDTFTYDLSLSKKEIVEPGNLFLLYGENGSGKTTVLNLIFHLLNPEPYGGHRSYLGKIPFESFEVYIGAGVRLRAFREECRITGKYTIEVLTEEEKQIIMWFWEPKTKDRDLLTEAEDALYLKFCNFLTSLNISFHFLRDTRRIEESSSKKERHWSNKMRILTEEQIIYSKNMHHEDSLSSDASLERSIDQAINWFRQKTLSGTNVGYTSVNSIYKDIIKRIVTFGKAEIKNNTLKVEDLKEKLVKLRERDDNFSILGLTPVMQIDDILDSLNKAKPQHYETLDAVLSPYLNGHNARLDALEDLQSVMFNFVSLLDDFYSYKKVSIHLKEGLQIKSKNKKVDISPFQLSSGERQLLLLLCQAICARNEGTIFVIDEPEISLNVKWQRKFIPALLTCLQGTNSQIILATHSIEILSQYKDYVVTLKNLESDF